ncbi:hypothetical protein MFIFM68171_03391 [Madurella fahalii]|uniref:DUF7708 domain-containing protein n=1 Tax=Madurella fahalii TaxID=1157608 RepID=A0ABQ0G608_9PEZI
MARGESTTDRGGRGESKKTFSPKNSEKVKNCEEKQTRLRSWASKSRKFTEQERSALRINSREAFREFWEGSLEAKDAFDIEHDDAAGRLAQGATRLAAAAYDIVQNVSPIVDIIKDFGAPYGGMAMGTICFVFAIAKNRASMEGQVVSTLADIKDRLPGVRMYQHIYNADDELDQQLQTKIVDAYDSFIDFCIAASDFYTCGSLRRWARALEGNRLDEPASRVQKAVIDVRLVCEELLSKNVNAVKNDLRQVRQQNVELKEQIRELKSQISDMQNDHDLELVRKLLSLEAMSDKAQLAQLERHRCNVAAEFQQSNWYGTTGLEQRLRKVEQGPDFQDWLRSPQSSLLVLAGRNDVLEAIHCWVSPIALDLIAKLTRTSSSSDDNANPCAFYLIGHRDVEDTPLDVLASLVLQLLTLSKEALRTDRAQFAELRAKLEEYHHAQQHGADTSAADLKQKLQDVASRALDLFGSKKIEKPTTTVWIILDRVDQCRAASAMGSPSPGTPGRSQHHRSAGRALLQTLVHLVEHAAAGVTVKVLAVVNRVDLGVEGDELGATRDESVAVLEVDQAEDVY